MHPCPQPLMPGPSSVAQSHALHPAPCRSHAPPPPPPPTTTTTLPTQSPYFSPDSPRSSAPVPPRSGQETSAGNSRPATSAVLAFAGPLVTSHWRMLPDPQSPGTERGLLFRFEPPRRSAAPATCPALELLVPQCSLGAMWRRTSARGPPLFDLPSPTFPPPSTDALERERAHPWTTKGSGEPLGQGTSAALPCGSAGSCADPAAGDRGLPGTDVLRALALLHLPCASALHYGFGPAAFAFAEQHLDAAVELYASPMNRSLSQVCQGGFGGKTRFFILCFHRFASHNCCWMVHSSPSKQSTLIHPCVVALDVALVTGRTGFFIDKHVLPQPQIPQKCSRTPGVHARGGRPGRVLVCDPPLPPPPPGFER